MTTPTAVSSSVVSLDGEWLLATDPKNAGRDEHWWQAPREEAVKAKVPWIIQEAFPAYHGVAWYWRSFTPPSNPHRDGRYLLRFWAVDYYAEVWVNGVQVGSHEGAETPFVLDVTSAIKAGAPDLIAVRVVNPDNDPIDGMTLSTTPRRCKVVPYSAGAGYDQGGIVDSVELLVSTAVRVEDLYARPDPATGTIHVKANLRNAAKAAQTAQVEFSVAPAASGEALACVRIDRKLAPGDSAVEAELHVPSPHLWQLNDPYLYRVTARVVVAGEPSFDETSTRVGFRDFRFADGYFRLNGKRIFLRSTHTVNHYPIGQQFPEDPDLLRRDMLNLKVMGFNCVRFIWGGATRAQLDLCDEIGLMVYEESNASQYMEDTPQMAGRFDHSVAELIRRDRNHPSIVIWGLMNEAPDNAGFHHATTMLPLVRGLDETRVVLLNSGRYDGQIAGELADLEIWRTNGDREPWITHNPLDRPIVAPFKVTWDPGKCAVHPGPKGEYSVARWTAPADGKASVSASWLALCNATVDVHVIHNDKSLFDGLLNLGGKGDDAAWTGDIDVRRGDTVDFACGWGNGSHGSDSTGIAASVKLGGKTYDVAADFSVKHNPNGAWTYGIYSPGPTPDAATFSPYTIGATFGGFGSIANPGVAEWQDILSDHHTYPRVPHTGPIIQGLRTLSGGDNHVFVSEYGIGSAVDLWRTVRFFEQFGKEDLEDGQFYAERLNRFLADYERWHLADTWARPEDFFAASLRKMAGQRTLGISALRSNPNVVGYSLTGAIDHVMTGEGLTTPFREFKPGTMDALHEGFAPLKWCLFAEPVNVYRGRNVRLEAVLADEDALRPGDYPVRIQVIGPDATTVLDRKVTLTIPDAPDAPFALPVFSEDVPATWPAGKYRLAATLERGGAATGGEVEFYVDDAALMPPVDAEVVLWGDAPGVAQWLAEHGVKTRVFSADMPARREVILCGTAPPAPGGAAAFADLARHVAQGSTAIFLCPEVFAKGGNPVAFLPLANKGALVPVVGWLYLKDEWAKRHPIFDGLPAGGLLDYTYYREIIPDALLLGQDAPVEAVAGAIKASQDYASGIMLSVYDLGAGRFVLNTLLVRENLGQHPAAERLLRNVLRYAARDADEPVADLPADFDAQLKALGYE